MLIHAYLIKFKQDKQCFEKQQEMKLLKDISKIFNIFCFSFYLQMMFLQLSSHSSKFITSNPINESLKLSLLMQKNGSISQSLNYNKTAADYFAHNKNMTKSLFPSLVLKLATLSMLLTLTFGQVITIRNVGCKSYTAGVCTACSTRYYLDSQQICQPVNPNCNTYNEKTGGCLSCYPGFGLIEDTCLPGIISNSFDPNCNSFKGNDCIKCSQGYFLNANSKCQAVNPACKTYDPSNGSCTSCFAGYEVALGGCVISTVQSSIPNCNQIDSASGKCVKCSFGYYFDANGNCLQSDPNCKTFNIQIYQCAQCYPGYNLDTKNACVKSQAPAGDPNCAKYNNQNVCLECSKGAFFSSEGICIVIDPSCLTFDQSTGRCLTCYNGYQVSQGTCILSVTGPNPNPYCSKWQGNVCKQCASGSYFDQNGICITVDPNCKDSSQGLCISCYDGYTLQINICVKSSIQSSTDSLCSKWQGQICKQCSVGTFLGSSGKCSIVNPLCMTFDKTNGLCLSCYQGYNLNNGACDVANQTGPADPNCKKFLTQDICSQCSDRYYIGSNGFCQEVNPLCNTYQPSTGICTSCFPGFALTNGLCTISNNTITDDNCKTWKGKVCLQCSQGAFFGTDGQCKVANPLCKTYDRSTGNCLSCYDFFDLFQGACIKNSNQTLSDPYCAQFMDSICIRCSVGYVFLSNGFCGLVNSNCKTHSQSTGQCTSCYMGFNLVNGDCAVGNDKNSAIDPNCAAFAAGACVRCSKNFYFGTNGSCLAVNPLCQTFDPTNGNCLSCYQSYVIANGSCIIDPNGSDQKCASWFEGICTSCSSRAYMDETGKCKEVSIDCNTYSPATGDCTSCYPGFALSQGKCSISSAEASCSKYDTKGKCSQCAKGSYLSGGSCFAIDTQCASFDFSSLSCAACYSGYSILNGVCQISKVDAQYEVENCYAYDNNSQCIKCYDRFFLIGSACAPVNVFCKTYDGYTGNCLSCYSTFTLSNGKCSQ